MAVGLRREGHRGLICPPVRHEGGCCFIAFDPGIIQHVRPGANWKLTRGGAPESAIEDIRGRPENAASVRNRPRPKGPYDRFSTQSRSMVPSWALWKYWLATSQPFTGRRGGTQVSSIRGTVVRKCTHQAGS